MISSTEVRAEAMAVVAELTCVNRILNRRIEALTRELSDLKGQALIDELATIPSPVDQNYA